MKNLLTAFLLMPVVAFAAPTVSDVTARQRYPWNGMVDIDYTVSGVTDVADVAAEITVVDRVSGKTYTPTKFLSVIPASNGRHRVTWSTEAEGVTIISTNVAVKVSLVSTSSAVLTDNLCYVIDLSGGPDATSYPVTTMRANAATVWPDEYKTTKLVLRRVAAGDVPTHVGCKITQPFYMGVFEVTLKQWMLVMGGNPYSYYNDHGEKAAVCHVSYDMIRGASIGAGWPLSYAVDATSFLGKLRSKTGRPFCNSGQNLRY